MDCEEYQKAQIICNLINNLFFDSFLNNSSLVINAKIL